VANVKWNGEQVVAAFRKAAQTCLSLAAGDLQVTVKKNLNLVKGPSTAGSPPGKGDGALGRSIQIDSSRLNEANPRIRVGSGLPYARIQETGQPTIRPVNAKALAIPIGRRGKQLSIQAGKSGLRSLGLMFWSQPGKPPLLCEVTGKRPVKFTPVFVLKKSVKLAPRPYFAPSMQQAGEAIHKRMDNIVTVARRFLRS
jgi:hypothetical protein